MFDPHTPLPRSFAPGGILLQPEPAALLAACRALGPLFVLSRNEIGIFGSVADPLGYLERENVRLAAAGALTVNYSNSSPRAPSRWSEKSAAAIHRQILATPR